MRTWRTAAGRRWRGLASGGERGSAVVEFLGVSLLLLAPLVYLVLVLGQVQAAAFAAEAAARETGRIWASATDEHQASTRAAAAVERAFTDQGLAVDGSDAVRLSCELDPCLRPGGQVHVQVVAEVELPLVPPFVRSTVPAVVPVSAEHVAVVDRFRERP